MDTRDLEARASIENEEGREEAREEGRERELDRAFRIEKEIVSDKDTIDDILEKR
jgi:hypothetical protein